MHGIQSDSRAFAQPAELSFTTLQQTAGDGANRRGRGVAITSEPVMLRLGDISPPPYSDVYLAPPPSYLEATGQRAQPRRVEAQPAPAQLRLERPNCVSCRNADGEKVLCWCLISGCVALMVGSMFC